MTKKTVRERDNLCPFYRDIDTAKSEYIPPTSPEY